MRLVVINGSAAPSGRTRLALMMVADAAKEAEPSLDVSIVNLAEDRVGIADHRKPEECEDDTTEVLERIASGDCFVIGSPIYRGSFTGALKNLLDRVPVQSMEGKPVGLVATAAWDHHYLAIDMAMRPVLAWFNAFQLPGSVYLNNSDYRDGKIVNPDVEGDLGQLGEALVAACGQLTPAAMGPPSLAGRV
ncbi:hypothetical protein A8B84_14840 [Marinobacter sp. EhC06]|uniref:NADPH-dependent FMN reductase n=1 Tax=Marinobacter TaxID=2742 RepID=UPI0007D8FA49|nr:MULTISPECIES: NAD(P)H-dependent oxidoreductase [unclassified Marinobacter]OAN87469.1 hypothetical protein A8B80_09545 [Marinobacter sp. EhN04]OAN87642.1 hypothetical protein A8B84_14840 [Marinobacter sp. EhC06]